MKLDDKIIALKERIRVYSSHSGSDATLDDLIHLTEDLLEVIEYLREKPIGFRNEI